MAACSTARTRLVLIAALTVLAASNLSASAWKVHLGDETDPNLPRVLLIGDSICNGYRRIVATKLKGKAIVDAWVTPLWVSHKGLIPGLKQALEARQYAVIHFNRGLHGFGDRIPEGQYGSLLDAYVAQMKKLAGNATLIWASTTPVNAKGDNATLDPERNRVVVKRNAIAKQVMQKHGVAIIDLYGLVVNKAELRARPEDLYHYNARGRTLQGEAIAARLLEVLSARTAP